MGSAALRTQSLLRGSRSLRRLERPLRWRERPVRGSAKPLRRLAILRRRLIIDGQSGGRADTHRLAATVLNVFWRLRLRLTEFTATKEPITISAAIRPYSIAVTPVSSLISLEKKHAIGRSPAGFNLAKRPIKSLIEG
jgi:hypothetical protein